jgi:hypothetical protein
MNMLTCYFRSFCVMDQRAELAAAADKLQSELSDVLARINFFTQW